MIEEAATGQPGSVRGASRPAAARTAFDVNDVNLTA